MPLLLPGRFATECVREFDLAADERYADALALADAGRRAGAVYLFGYVAEMLLKAAYFRLIGFTDDQPITFADLRNAVGEQSSSTARQLNLPGVRNLHDLSAWAALIVAYRTANHLAYADRRFGATVQRNTRAVRDRWTEVIRYHKNTAYGHELARVRAATGWFVRNRAAI